MKYEILSKLYYKDRDIFEQEYASRKNSPLSVSLGFHIKDWEAFYCAIPEFTTLLPRIYKKHTYLQALRFNLPNIAYDFYERHCLIDEIMLTNDIEGIRSTRKEIIDVLNSEVPTNKTQRFEGLIHKYALLLDDSPSHYHVALNSSQDIRNIYNDIVLDEIDPANRPDGDIFRKSVAEVISGTQQVKHVGVYPETLIVEYIDKVLFLFQRDDIPTLFKIAILHYMIGYIHPFYDGNGRLSRFISSYLLKQEFGALVALRLSYTIKNLKTDYYKAFDICNDPKNRGDLTPFLLYFADVVEQSMDSLTEKLKTATHALEGLSHLLQNKYAGLESKEQKKTIDILWYLAQNELFSSELLDKQALASLLHVSASTVHNYILELMAAGIPIEIKKESRKFVYSLNVDQLCDYLNDTK